MAQSSSDLTTIHLKRLATPGRKYYGDNERVYLGTLTGRLKLLTLSTDTVSGIPSPNITNNINNIISANNLKEIPLLSGVIDGVNKVFTWKYTPLIIELNGQTLRDGGVGYTLSGTTTVLINSPFTGEYLWAYGNY